MPEKVSFILLTVTLLLTTLLVPCSWSAPARDSTGFAYAYIEGRKYYRVYDIASRLRLRVVKHDRRYELFGASGRMVLNPDKRYGSFNGIVINFDFAPMERHGQLYISSADFFNHVQVLFNPRSLRPVGIRTILIDPGHGGSDRGAAGQRYTEKALTLQVAKRLQRILSKMGYRVLMTRVNDRRIELSNRARASNAARADLFISIHMNAAANRSVSGIETFALTAPGAPSSGSNKVQYTQYPGNAAVNNSMFLAWNVQSELIRNIRCADRGVKQARFVVLRETRCPSILVECGFISNRKEENKLGNASYQESLALAIARGVYNYHRSLRK